MQNLLVLRFANSIFEPLWNQKYIDHVQITVAEEEGLAQYDAKTRQHDRHAASAITKASAPARHGAEPHAPGAVPGGDGAAVVAGRPTWSATPRSACCNCLRPMTADDVDKIVVRGQYIEGDMHGQRVPGYRKEVRESFESMNKPLPPDSVNSTTETFVALQLFIDNWRWAGVPFYLRTGKRLPKRASEVAIQFKDVPQVLFNAHPDVPLEPTVLVAARAAGGGPVDAHRLQAAGAEGPHLSGEDGVQLQLQLRRQHAGSVRTAACWT